MQETDSQEQPSDASFRCPRCRRKVPMAYTLTDSVWGERMCSDCWDDEEGGY